MSETVLDAVSRALCEDDCETDCSGCVPVAWKRYNHLAEIAIRAYEAHKETTFDPTAQLGGVIPPPSAVSRPRTDAVGYKEGDVVAIASAVPEEIAKVVKDLRIYLDLMDTQNGEHKVPWMYNVCKRAADLLEGYALADCAPGAAREMRE